MYKFDYYPPLGWKCQRCGMWGKTPESVIHGVPCTNDEHEAEVKEEKPHA